MQAFVSQTKPLTVIEFLADGAVCFGAVIIASTQILHHGSLLPDSMSLAPQIKEWAAGFALVMSLMFTFVGIYRRGTSASGIWSRVKRSSIAVMIGTAIALAALLAQGKGDRAVLLIGWTMFYVTI